MVTRLGLGTAPLAGLYHAYKTPKSIAFAAPEGATNGAKKVLIEA